MRVSPSLEGSKVAVWHLEKIAGGDFVYTCPLKFIKALIMNCDEIEFSTQIDEDPPREVIERLLKIPYFEKAYFENGLSEEEFIHHPSLVAMADQFSKRTLDMIDFVSKLLEMRRR